MVNWSHQEEEFCEGTFKIKNALFCDDENGGEMDIGCAGRPELMECAEKCAEAFNDLAESEIAQICKEIINCAEEGGLNEDFELPAPDDPLDILNYCWFTTLYVNMLSREDDIAYVVEGEGEWGEAIGFVIENNEVVYVGVDYLDYMKEE